MPETAEPLHTLTVAELGAAFRSGRITPVEATEHFLERASNGPAHVYRKMLTERAREQAGRATAAFGRGEDAGPLQGIPLALKDNLGVLGEVTAAGSAARLARAAPEQADSDVAMNLDAAGAVFLALTNMTEFAFAGLGLNPHFGTPVNALDPLRVPGGSSAGAAVAVAAGLATAAIGTDTGGSVRVPAAFNGLHGLKVTDRLVSARGVVPLSTTLDTVGPFGRDAADLQALLAGMTGRPIRLPDLPGRLRLLVPETVLLDDLDEAVGESFGRFVAALKNHGHVVDFREVPVLAEVASLSIRFGHPGAHESLVLHAEQLAEPEAMDRRVVRRMRQAEGLPASDYIRYHYERERLGGRFWDFAAGWDAVLAPTSAHLPPLLADVEADDGAFTRANLLALRNAAVFNALAGPALNTPGPVALTGMMLAAAPGRDAFTLALAGKLAPLQQSA